MAVAFFISSVGDTDLALSTIQAMESRGDHRVFLISLTKAAADRVADFSAPLLLDKKTLPDLLGRPPAIFLEGPCTEEQLDQVMAFIHGYAINYAYFGVPSVDNDIPFQIARRLNDIPVLMAYEFMFKPERHCIWKYVPELNKPNVRWALPLADAKMDFEVDDKWLSVIGHLSIDNAYKPKPVDSKSPEAIKHDLQVTPEQSLAFISSTTQPVAIDATFLDSLLTELPNHPQVQMRLGLHPGIKDLNAYLATLLSIYIKYPAAAPQFKIIVPDNLLAKLKYDELSHMHPHVFLRANINGQDASSAADRVAQAVPGALLNQAVLEGKPAFASLGKPYLPRYYFADNITTFFSGLREPPRTKEALGLDERTVGERCADIILSLA